MNKSLTIIFAALIIILGGGYVFYNTSHKDLTTVNNTTETTPVIQTEQKATSTTQTTKPTTKPTTVIPVNNPQIVLATFRASVINGMDSGGGVTMKVTQVIQGSVNETIRLNVQGCGIRNDAGSAYLIEATTTSGVNGEFNCKTARYAPPPQY
ncbi:MAG: hypothetical protein JWN90_315 [Parcubacteria group bacterium]|nr:hypothetical protein [Parcubacteria group bacterium]